MPLDNSPDPVKKVGDAVERLLSFNEQFRCQVEVDSKRFQELGQATYQATSEYARMVNHAGSLAHFAIEVDTALARLESDTAKLNSIAEEYRCILQESMSAVPNGDSRLVGLVGLLARAVSDHQRLASASLGDHAVSIRATLAATADRLDKLAGAAQKQVAVLDEAIMISSLKAIGRSQQSFAAHDIPPARRVAR